jgi:hypothetical protein
MIIQLQTSCTVQILFEDTLFHIFLKYAPNHLNGEAIFRIGLLAAIFLRGSCARVRYFCSLPWPNAFGARNEVSQAREFVMTSQKYFFSLSYSDYFYHRMLVKLKAARKFGII